MSLDQIQVQRVADHYGKACAISFPDIARLEL
jgi:hypothetical protein